MKKHIVLISILILATAMSCSMPIELNPQDTDTAEESVNSGSLIIAVPHVAPWVQDFEDSQSRAVLYTTQVKVEIKDSLDADVITPVYRTIAMDGLGGTGTLESIDNIPSGTGYTVIVSIFNSAVSAIDPVVTGEDAISIDNNQTTNASVACLPQSPASLTADAGPWTATLGLQAETWYSVAMAAGTIYTISQDTVGMGTFLFGTDGTLVGTILPGIPYEYSCTASGTYYIGVAATVAGTSNLDITSYIPPLNEGSAASPVVVGIDAERTFQIGRTGSGEQDSYYSFTTGDAGTYYFDSDLSISTLLDIYLYSDSAYSALLTSTTSSPSGMELTGLAAATTYYLRLHNSSSNYDFSFPGRIVSPAAALAGYSGEGSIATPSPLAINTTESIQAGINIYDRYSYYEFTTGTGTEYSIAFTNMLQDMTYFLYSDSSFTTLVKSGSLYNSIYSSSAILTPGTTYYLEVRNDQLYASSVIPFDLTISEISEYDLALSTLAAGTLSATAPYIWYALPVTEGLSYSVYWDDSYQGSGVFSCDVKVSIYHSDKATSYYTNVDSGYTTPKVVTIPAGESFLYIKVVPYITEYTGTFGLWVNP